MCLPLLQLITAQQRNRNGQWQSCQETGAVVPVDSQRYRCLQPSGEQGKHKPKGSQRAPACPDIPVHAAKHRDALRHRRQSQGAPARSRLDGHQELLFSLLQAMISDTDSLSLPPCLTFSHAGFSTLPRGA
jgi:hypothetical protein